MLPPKFVSPPYTAVILCAPTVSVLVLNVAMPLPSSVPLPMGIPPSWKVTVPVGVPLAVVTVAVKVTGCPESDGFNEEVREVVVGGRGIV